MLQLKAIGTIEEQAILTEALCYRFNYSDTVTKRTEIVTPTKNEKGEIEDVISYNDEVVANIGKEEFATLEISKFLNTFVNDYINAKAKEKVEERQKALDEEIRLEAEKSKIEMGI